MSVSIIDVLKEQARQALTGDREYAKAPRWMFRIRSPKGNRGPCGPTGEALFPLPINPDKFEYTLPFANELTPQQEGGVVVEDTGIVIASISMSGTTGFKLRRNRAKFRGGQGSKFCGDLADTGTVFVQDVSGQMAFWILASKCFEGYSELKADPETSSGTILELHIPKEHLALEVVPKSFVLTRSASSERVTYRYNINLEVIGEVGAVDFLEDEEDIFDEILDTITTIRDTIQSVAATLDDINAMAQQLRRVWQGLSSFIDDVGTVLRSATNFVNGIKSFIDIPRSFIQSVADVAEDAADLFEASASLPADVGQSIRSLGDDLDRLIVASRDNFKSSWQAVADAYNKRATDRYNDNITDDDEKDQISDIASDASGAGGGLTADQVYSKPFLPGDERRARLSKAQTRLKTGNYSGFLEKPVGQGDTLAGIAARELGDARRWTDLALINNLSPPYITSGPKLPGTLQPGSRIIIPVNKPVQPAQVLTTGNPETGGSQADAHLGVDYEYVLVSKGQWGWKIDATHGSVDGVKTNGIGNLAQGLGSRLRTQRGTNILFPDVGLPRLVGVDQAENPATEVSLRVRQQILADPRVDRLHSATLEVVKDAVTITIKAQPVGALTPRTISQTLT
jgi:hypothetical protein